MGLFTQSCIVGRIGTPPPRDINDDWTDDPPCGILRDAWLAIKPNRIERT